MEITPADRVKLREKQQSLNARFTIGNLVEHKTQDPKRYKELSRQRESSSLTTREREEFKITYQSKYLTSNSAMTDNQEARELEIPISIGEVEANMWLNMDQVEFEKLEWMTSRSEKRHQEQIKGSTRFDKDGRVIQSDSKPTKKGDQGTGVDGHDLESLVKLLDSTYQPQVVYGLNVVTKIASYATMGYYDGTFDENIHQLLLKNCLLRVRYQIDSTNETSSQYAIKCMRALLCNNQVDEVILDRIFPLIADHSDQNLWLETAEMASKEFTIGMKDTECVEIDAVKALVERTFLLTRFTNLLRTKNQAAERGIHDCILDILIRIARHSPYLACLINRNDLMTAVINLFLPHAITTDNEFIRPLSTKTLKLIRLVTEGLITLEKQQQPIPVHLGSSNKLPSTIIPVLNSYITIDCLSSLSSGVDDLFKLHLETIRCLKTFSLFKQFKDDVISMLAMNRDKFYVSFQAFSKLDSTKKMGSKISFDWQYAAHLIDLIGSRSKNELNHPGDNMKKSIWNLFAKPILFRWINDMTKDMIVPHLDVSIAMVTTLKHFNERSDQSHGSELRNHLFKPIVEGREKNGTRSPNIFKILARSATQKSRLSDQLDTSGRLRDPNNLPSYGWLQFNSATEHRFQLDPLFETDSPFFLLDVYLSLIDKWDVETPEAINMFLELDILRYLRSISGYQKKPLRYETFVQQSFSSQFEIRLIVKTIILMSKCYIALPEPEKFPDLDSRLENEKYEFRKDDYGNLCYYAVSTIGLLYENDSSNLKDELFRRLLLNQELQDKICIENLSKPSSRQLVSYVSGELIDLCHKSTRQLSVLTHIYDCCIPVDRFWIFQPILLFYVHVIRDSGEDKSDKMKNPKWLVENMPWREQVAEIRSKDDAHLISAILNFNYKLMRFSSSYKEFVIRPRIEDYICMVAVMFLHDDIFLDQNVSRSIEANMEAILEAIPGNDIDWIQSLFQDASRKIETFELPLADFFNSLVDQYESVSYGDLVFTNIMLLFLSPYSDKIFKKKLFQEKLDTCVRQIRIGCPDVWLPRRIYFSRKEPDQEVRDLYQRAKRNAVEGTFLQEFLDFHTS